MSDRLVARRQIYRPSTVAKRRAAEADHLPAPDAALGNAASVAWQRRAADLTNLAHLIHRTSRPHSYYE